MFQPHPPARKSAALCLLLLSSLLAGAAIPSYIPSKQTPPPPAREFRGAWVASVSNIDWPSKPGLSVTEQKTELQVIIQRASQLRLNAIILQVRPGCDALYPSKLEPWSEYLTGQMGKAPEPFYDPLAFAIAEAHARGLELHAWINPFRARHPSAKMPVAPGHISVTQPAIVKTYGRHLWLDPGEPAAQDHSLKVALDLIKRYDLDGVHMDDYFYPYKEKDTAGNVLDFPDDPSWQRYVAKGGKLSRADWRRDNINHFLEKLYRAVKAEKPWVKVGLSPFGIWRPRVPPEIVGYDPYENLYADSRKWLMNGWLDYFAPQLYWPIDAKGQSFPVLLQWWTEQNPKKRHIWPGMATVNTIKAAGGWPPEEIVNQVKITRKYPAAGQVHWSARGLRAATNSVGDLLAKQVYTDKALAPLSPWLSRAKPATPKVYLGGNPSLEQLTLAYEYPGVRKPRWWILQAKYGNEWRTEVFGGDRTLAHYNGPRFPDALAIYAADNYGNLSNPVVFERR